MATANQLLPGTGRPEPEGDHVGPNGVDVALLPGRLGANRAALGAAHDVVGEHPARSLVVADHLDAAPGAGLVEVLPLLEQNDQFLAQPADHIGLGPFHVDLVAAHHEVGLGEGVLDHPQVHVAMTDQSCHQVGTGDDDGERSCQRGHVGRPCGGRIRLYGSEAGAHMAE